MSKHHGWSVMRARAVLRATVLVAALWTISLAGYAGSTAINGHASVATTATPIKHIVIIFDENVSFDHYFGTYPHAANTDGVPWHALPDTPTVNGLTKVLLKHNPNSMDPQRLGPSEAYTCDNIHAYKAEQKAYDGGLMNRFVQFTEGRHCDPKQYDPPGLVMDYYDGNTVTALWNYAQRFAMSDNNYASTFGPSTPGAINIISGNTHGAVVVNARGQRIKSIHEVASPNAKLVGTLVRDPDPTPKYDMCVDGNGNTAFFTGRNIGNLLNEAHVTWGWFSGGFTPTRRKANGDPICGSSHRNVAGVKMRDYVPHHEPFQYYRSTSNPKHLPPSSVAAIGHTDKANHQYGLQSFYAALKAGNLPAVSYVKAPAYEDGHAGYSDPLDEQRFLVTIINAIGESRAWKTTAIVITYDDSDGWYDHAMAPIVNPSSDPLQDRLNGRGRCGDGTPMKGYQDRCGYGPRLPLLVISPFARVNYVNHALTSQTSVLRFIEHNWLHDRRIGDGSYDQWAGSLMGMFDWSKPHYKPLILNACTGQVSGNATPPRQCPWPKQRGGR